MSPLTLRLREKVRLSVCWLTCLPILFFCSGCQIAFQSHSSTRTETTIKNAHNIVGVSNGTTRTLEYSGEVVIDRGRIERISPGCVIHAAETSFGRKTVAEVREKNGKPELWMRAGKSFRPANARESR